MEFSIKMNREGSKAPELPVVIWEDLGGEVSVEGAVVQAAQAIDMAGKLAVENQDAETLLRVGDYFTKLADFIMALSEQKRKNDLDTKKSDLALGFQVTNKEEK